MTGLSLVCRVGAALSEEPRLIGSGTFITEMGTNQARFFRSNLPN